MPEAVDQEDTVEWLRRVAVKASSETAGLLRDMACTEGIEVSLGGETTVADKKAEDYIIDIVRHEARNVQIISEERGGRAGGEGIVALIDPLDGSSNYVSCISWASVSIAFADLKTGALLAGSVAPVFWGYPFSFAKNKGCYEGGRRLHPKIRGSIIALYVDEPGAVESVSRVLGSVKRHRDMLKARSLGSAALELSMVGSGYVAAFVDLRSRLRNIDVAAAVGIISECGGSVVDDRGQRLKVPLDGVKRVGNVIAALDRNLLKVILASL